MDFWDILQRCAAPHIIHLVVGGQYQLCQRRTPGMNDGSEAEGMVTGRKGKCLDSRAGDNDVPDLFASSAVWEWYPSKGQILDIRDKEIW